jgi:hypothetical protein
MASPQRPTARAIAERSSGESMEVKLRLIVAPQEFYSNPRSQAQV